MITDLLKLIEKLTGQKIPLEENIPLVNSYIKEDFKLGYSQFNELLLFLGYDRINNAFFTFLASGSLGEENEEGEEEHAATIENIKEFEKNVYKAIEYFLVLYGNIKFGYKKLSSTLNQKEFVNWYYGFQPVPIEHFTKRHNPLLEIDKIDNDDTYLLGYLIQRSITERLEKNPGDEEALQMKEKMKIAIEKGKKNHRAYLASDHMDVYVATSMRQKHEYLFISRITEEIFNHEHLANLKVRYFDPTQAYCSDRIDKGIAEALMLKRAECTIYLAQETDTLGKDSELASTLAQGKTVIAYIPKADKEYVDKLLQDLQEVNPGKSRKSIILEQLRIFDPESLWTNEELRKSIDNLDTPEEYFMQILYSVVESKYDSRAKTLKDTHPLGIQVNLETGVANGVIVTREIAECAKLVRNVLLGIYNFKIEEVIKEDIEYVFLKEELTGSVYRVSTGEKLLANTFWNYYLPNK